MSPDRADRGPVPVVRSTQGEARALSALASSATSLTLGASLAVASVEPLALWPLTLGILSCFALVLALPVAWLRMRGRTAPLSPWSIAGAIALGCVLTARPWSLPTGWPIGLACGALFLSGPLWIHTIRARWWSALSAWAIATAVLWLSLRAYVGLYPSLHIAAVVLTLSIASLAAACHVPLGRHMALTTVFALGMLGCAVLSFTPWAARNEVRSLAISQPSLAPHLLLAAWSLTDFDGDGASTLWGGADCDGLDPELGPGNWDTPGDGVDQDCTGRDRPHPPKLAARQPAAIVKSVLIVTADSLRPDALGAYGAQPLPVSPHLDAWAKGAVRFERAYGAAPETRASLPVLLWGQYGPGKNPSLAQRVRERGLEARAVLSREAHFSAQARSAGFELIEVPRRDSSSINASARTPLEQVATQGGVLWVHYHDPHAPYEQAQGIDWGSDARARYLALVTRMDRAFGELLERVPPDMAVMFAADHGEAFGEHGASYHRSSLYDEQIRIPLLIAAPGIASRVVSETVGLIDLYATALDLLGLQATPAVASRSLVPALRAEPLGDAPYRATTWSIVEGLGAPRTWVGLFYGPFKLLRRTDWNVDEVYDMRADPHELHPNTGEAARMHGALLDRL